MSRLTDAQLQSPPTLNASTDGKPRSLRTGKPMGHNHHWYPDGKFIGDKTWEIFMRDYVRTVRGVDDAIGRLLDKLDKMRISENTLVIHTSDHGYFHGEFGLADKRWMYDPSIRVPYLIRYPKLIRRPGRIVEDLVLSLDIPATIMDLSGLGVPQNFQGHSLKSLMIETDEWTRDAVFIEYFEDPPFPALPTMICLRTTDEKIVHYLREGEGDEFYDLVRDPGEQRNVIDDSEYAGRVSQMKNRLEETRNRYDFTVPDLSKQY
ncbi:MAG: sulfatase/phosphatase domain-containing protein [Candidatus Poribacteria bacterium]